MGNLCGNYSELISAFVDSELSAEETAELQKHLEACPDCRAHLDAIQKIHAAGTDLLLDVPEGFSTRVMNTIKLNKKAEKRFALSRFKFTAIAAAIVLLVLAAGKLESFAPRLAETQADSASNSDIAVQETQQPPDLVPATLSPLTDNVKNENSTASSVENKAKNNAVEKKETVKSVARSKNAKSPTNQTPAVADDTASPEAASPQVAQKQETAEVITPSEPTPAIPEAAPDQPVKDFSEDAAGGNEISSEISSGSSSSLDSGAIAGGSGAAAGGGSSSTIMPEQEAVSNDNDTLPDISVDTALEDTADSSSEESGVSEAPEIPLMPPVPQTEAYAFCIVVEGPDVLALFSEFPSKIFEGNYIISFDKSDKSKVISQLKDSGFAFYEYAGDSQISTGLIIIVLK